MSEQLSNNVRNNETEKPLDQIERELESIEQVSIEQYLNKMSQAVLYCDILSQGRTAVEGEERKKISEGKKIEISSPDIANIVVETAKWLTMTQQEVLQKGVRNDNNAILYDLQPKIKDLSQLIIKYISEYYLYKNKQDLLSRFKEIFQFALEIKEQGEKSRKIRNQLTRKWERVTGNRWDRRNWNFEFPYDSTKEPEFRSEYLQSSH